MQRFVTYRRVSTKEQGKSGLGLEAQSRDIALYLASYAEEPWEVIGEFTEVDSGANADRPELTKAMALAKKEKATLLVAKVDRLSRDVEFIAGVVKKLGKYLRIATLPQAAKFEIHLWAILAEQERDFISHRTKAALAEAKKNGRVLGGLRDTTMRRNDALRETADANAERLRTIVLPMVQQGRTLRAMAEALDSAGVKTPRGGQWHAKTVQRLIGRLSI